MLERGRDDRSRRVGRARRASMSPRPRTSTTPGSAARPPGEPVADLSHVLEQLVGDRVADGAGGRAGDAGCRRTSRRASPAAKPAGRLVGDEQRADRQPVREPLGERDELRADARLLEGEERSGPADAALDLVEAEQRPDFARRSPQPPRGTPARAATRRPRRARSRSGRAPCRRRARRRPRATRRRSGRAKETPGTSGPKPPAWPAVPSPRARRRAAVEGALERDDAGRPVARRAYLSAASIASAPELQKNACAPPNRSESFAASSSIGSVQ